MCTEYFKKTNKYWHFKTTNPDFIKVSMEGVQDNVLKVSYKFNIKIYTHSNININKLGHFIDEWLC